MYQMRIVVTAFLILAFLPASATELSDRAAEVTAVGVWVKVDEWATYEPQWDITNGFESWQDSINWVSQEQHLAFRISSASDQNHYECIYDEATNAWAVQTFGSQGGGHAYDKNAMDPFDGDLYYRLSSGPFIDGVWGGSSYTWSSMVSGGQTGLTGPQAFMGWYGTAGGLFAVLTSPKEINVWDKALDSWATDVYPFPAGYDDSHSHAEYHQGEEYMMIISGNDDENAFVLDKDATSLVQVDDSPAACATDGSQNGVNGNDLFYNFEISQLIYYCGSTTKDFYFYDRTDGPGGSWNLIAGVTLDPPPSGMEIDKPANVLFASNAALGVTLVVNAQAASTDAGKCGTNNSFGCGLWVTKFGSVTCGDGIDDGEDCDDGNLLTLDGCDASCLVETGWFCDASFPSVCNPTNDDIAWLGANPPTTMVWHEPTDRSLSFNINMADESTPDADDWTRADDDRDSTLTCRSRVAAGGAWTACPPIAYVDPGIGPNCSDPNNCVGQGCDTGSQTGWPSCTGLETIRSFWGGTWGLAANVSYLFEFTLNDPDGINIVWTACESGCDVTTTAAQTKTDDGPLAYPATPATPVYECPGGGAGDRCDTAAEIQTAVTGAGAGSMILIAAGTYDFNGATLTINTGGTEIDPTVIRCDDRATTILTKLTDDGNATIALNASHVYIENCKIKAQVGETAIDGQGGDYVGIVIRQNIYEGIYTWGGCSEDGGISCQTDDQCTGTCSNPSAALGCDGFVIEGGSLKASYFQDNQMTGSTEPGDTDTASSIVGIGYDASQGIVIERNFLRGMGDSIASGRPDVGNQPNANIVLANNLIEWSMDDAIEVDFSHGPHFIYDNLILNSNSCLSAQPNWSGPVYYFRNICWTGDQPLKHLKLTTSSGNNTPQNVWVWNNLITTKLRNGGGGYVISFDFRNNLLIGDVTQTDIVSFGSTEVYGRFPEAGLASTQLAPTINYNGYGYAGVMDWTFTSCASPSSPSALCTNCGLECNGVALNSTVFADDSAMIPAPGIFPDSEGDNEVYYRIYDPRLHASSNAVDAGTAITELLTGESIVVGTAMDIGPYERSGGREALTVYGPSWTTKDAFGQPVITAFCNDGIDNDQDGDTDYPADAQCAGPNDPGELYFQSAFAAAEDPPDAPATVEGVAVSGAEVQ